MLRRRELVAVPERMRCAGSAACRAAGSAAQPADQRAPRCGALARKRGAREAPHQATHAATRTEVHREHAALAHAVGQRKIHQRRDRAVLVAVHEVEARAVVLPVFVGAAAFVVDAAVELHALDVSRFVLRRARAALQLSAAARTRPRG